MLDTHANIYKNTHFKVNDVWLKCFQNFKVLENFAQNSNTCTFLPS